MIRCTKLNYSATVMVGSRTWRNFATAVAEKIPSYESDYQTMDPSPLPTYYFQKSLPKLPVPKLELTCRRYLDSVKCILSPEEFLKTEKVVKMFEEGAGKNLHEALVRMDKQLQGTSYISGPWFEMYLADRQPLPINYNPALVFVEDDIIDKLPLNQRQLVRTTNLLISSLRFMKSLDSKTLGPEVYHMNPKKSDTPFYYRTMKLIPSKLSTYGSYIFKAFPLDMSQFKSLFKSTRIPQTGIDKIQATDDVRHIVVMRRGNFYSVPVLDKGGDILPVGDIMGNLEAILEDSCPVEGYPLGLMTTQDRNKWAEIRNHLITSNTNNQKALSEIDSAIFVLCLDDEVLGVDPVKVTRNFLHSDGTNRWFDKSFQMISTKDGWAGVTFEHAWGDGVAVMRFFNEIHKDAKTHQWSNSVKPKRPNQPPRQLVFQYDEKAKSGIESARSRLLAQTESLDIHTFIYEKFGKQECKKWAISPDSVMQLGFQIAFHRLFNHTPATYESCSTAVFKHGRTEAIRPATGLTQEVSRILSSAEWGNRKGELKELIKKCSQKHNELTKDAAMGQGFDRHLFAMRNIAKQQNMEIPDIYKDEGYRRINLNVLSTSTLASPAVRIGSFGPVLPDGYGLGYQIWEGGLGCVAATYKGKKDGKAWVDTCEKVFTDIKTIMSS